MKKFSKKEVKPLIKALHGLSMPLGRMDYTPAQLDKVVRKLAENALQEFEKKSGASVKEILK